MIATKAFDEKISCLIYFFKKVCPSKFIGMLVEIVDCQKVEKPTLKKVISNAGREYRCFNTRNIVYISFGRVSDEL